MSVPLSIYSCPCPSPKMLLLIFFLSRILILQILSFITDDVRASICHWPRSCTHVLFFLYFLFHRQCLSFRVLVFVLPWPYLCPSMSLTLYFHALSFSFHALIFVLPCPCLCTSTSDTSLTWLVSDLFHSLVHATDLHDPISLSPCRYFVFSSSMFLLLSISKLCPSISLCYTFVRCSNCYHYPFNPCFYNLPTLIFPVPNPKSFVHCSRCYHYLFHLSFLWSPLPWYSLSLI